MTLNEDIFDDIVLVEVPDVVAPIEAEDITPPGPEVGEATGIADMILDLINDENEAIKGYNDAKANITCPDFAKVIDDIAAEEMNHVGMLQTLLKKVSPNAEVISQGEEEAENMLQENLENIERTLGKNPKLEIHGEMPITMADAVIESEEADEEADKRLKDLKKFADKPFLGADKQPVPNKPVEPKISLDESLFEDYGNVREYSDQLFDMIEEDMVDAKEIAKDLIYWCSEEDIKRFMEVRDLIWDEDEDIDESLYENFNPGDKVKILVNRNQEVGTIVDNPRVDVYEVEYTSDSSGVTRIDTYYAKDLKLAEPLQEGRKAKDFIDSEGNVFTDEDRFEEDDDEDDLFTQVMEELCPTTYKFMKVTKLPDLSWHRYDADELSVTYDGDIQVDSADTELAQKVADAYGLNTRESRTGLIIEIPDESSPAIL